MISGNGSGSVYSHPFHDDWMGETVYTENGLVIEWHGPNGENHGSSSLMGLVDLEEEAARGSASPELKRLIYEHAAVVEQVETIYEPRPKRRRL